MSVDALLARLEGVKRTGAGRWMARCPAHEDKHPSLSVREKPDGRVLLRCFASCSFEEIVSASGVDISELFPPRALGDYTPRERRPYPAEDVLAAVVDELNIAFIIIGDIEAGREADIARLRVARARIESAKEIALGRF